MVLALAATGIVIVALLGEVMLPRLEESLERFRARRRRIPSTAEFDLDPGRERRAEARARLLLKSCVNDEEWAMYRDLGFIRVWGMQAGRPSATRARDRHGDDDDGVRDEDGVRGWDGDGREDGDAVVSGDGWRRDGGTSGDASGDRGGWGSDGGASGDASGDRGGWGRDGWGRDDDVPYAYLVYPHKPILSYVPQTGRLLNEYCVEFPDETRPYGSARLPDSDDVLAKWMALTGDEQRLMRTANMHLPGRQIDPRQVKRDLWRLRQWEQERARSGGDAARDSRVPAS
ncbi:hypothetical protein [Conexibacter woesei]|uniref:Uncharacterized protein n=1 Tax=Conexibacter woesei (strain DSM 14684 / CCUG 47730 / CIP 108061 / JCM 11494 / NBRC 100937 / ID131577) TaxID=469383 RepID=D3F1C4_CONWI|nr:hypothetical protein [Conexibacter woesei]ADB52087.1 hypothetical protein Cwoe_3670 [Conexibacter woesei DSM 14684]